MRRKMISAALCLGVAASATGALAGVSTTVLQDFESGSTAGAFAVTTGNSSAAMDSNSGLANVTDGGSKRLRLTDADGGTNGCGITLTGVIPEAGYYLVTAAVKVDNSSTPIGSFGMAAVVGDPTTSKPNDTDAGYIMNLTGSGDAALGYQTIGAAIEVYDGPFPKNVTLYFSTNPSGNNFNAAGNSPGGTNAPATDGTFLNNHRTGTSTWAGGSTNAVYIDDVKLIGPGTYGDDRHIWISVGSGYTNLARLQMEIDNAELNNFNVVDLLARYRSDAYYVPNRDFSTYPNPEPYGTLISGGTPSPQSDPLQYTIDQCRERGMKTYISFSSCLTRPASDTYPTYLPTDSISYYYNGGSPRPMTTSDPGGSEGLWADIGVPALRNYLVDVCRDIVQNYDIQGVILDRVRYPDSNAYGYNPAALTAMGIVGTPTPTDATFIEKRRQAVTDYVQAIYEGVTDTKPWVVAGTVPVVYGYDFSATYSTVFQFFPYWSARKTRNRVIDFGAQDIMQHQLYRQAGGSYELYNAIYMEYHRYGDLARYPLDFGMMPGANAHLQPLFYHPSTNGGLSSSIAQAGLIAQNFCDSRMKEGSGGGIFAGNTARANMHSIRAASTSCGSDALAGKGKHADFLMKSGYDNVPPLAVTGLGAAPAGALQVNLSWGAPAAAGDGETAAKYLIYRGTQPGVKRYYATQRNKAVTVSGTTYSDTVPEAGNYYYSVVSVDDYNNYGPAVEIGPVSATGAAAGSAPTAPSNLQLIASGNAVYVTWNDNSNNETSFQVLRNGTLVATLSENVPTYREDDVVAGTHTYQIRALNSAGFSSSGTANVTTANTLSAPGAPSACDSGGGVLLTWTDTTSNESGFEILRGTAPGGPYARVASVSPGSSGYSDSTLTPGTYYYRVRSFNGLALSRYSTEVSATVVAGGIPSAPSSLSASISGATVTLTWSQSSCNETGFEVFRSTVSGGPYTLVGTTGADGTTLDDTVPGTGAYYYVVRAVNGSGASAYSNEAQVTAAVPSAPSGLSAAVSNTTVQLSWTDVATNESGYEVLRGTTPGGPYTLIFTTAPNATSINDFHTVAGTYYYVVRAFSVLGTSGNSNEAAATVSAPAAPSGLTSTVVGPTVNLTWTDNSGNETAFEVRRSTSPGGPYTLIATKGANATTHPDQPGVGTHYYVVRATNAIAASPDSNEHQASVVGTVPNPPIGLSATVTSSRAALTWTDASVDETSFTVWRALAAAGPFTKIATLAANSTSYTDVGLGFGTHYYQLFAVSEYGSSSGSNVATAPVADANCIIESRVQGGALAPASAYEEFIAAGGVWGNTTAKSRATGVVGTGSRFTGDSSLGVSAVFRPAIATGGYYDLFITLPAANSLGGSTTSGPNNHSPGAEFQITGDNGLTTGTFNLSRFQSGTCDETLLFGPVTDCWMLFAEDVPLAPGNGNTIRVINRHTGSANSLNRFNIDSLRVEFKTVPVQVSEWGVE